MEIPDGRGGTRGYSGGLSYIPAIIVLQYCAAAGRNPLLHTAIHAAPKGLARGGPEAQIPRPGPVQRLNAVLYSCYCRFAL